MNNVIIFKLECLSGKVDASEQKNLEYVVMDRSME